MENTVNCSQRQICHVLHRMGIPIHRVGYKYLVLAIAGFLEDGDQSLTKSIYPGIALRFGYSDWRPVEHAIRLAIQSGWAGRVPEIWARYFPCARQCPSNKQFIATVAVFLGLEDG